MGMERITVDISRNTITADVGGGETTVTAVVYSGVEVTISYPDKSAVSREEIGGGAASGPGTFTRSDRVVFLEPWDGTIAVSVNDIVTPNPSVNWLPTSMEVIAVRRYPDDGGELQLDVDDVN